MTDILITGGTVVTMDPQRRVIENGAVAVTNGRLSHIGTAAELAQVQADKQIDATRMVIMPGFIDAHAHAGHGLVKNMGGDNGAKWYEACSKLYTEGSTEAFWYAEAALSALERLKCGTTTGVSLLGGGDYVVRTDDPVFGDHHCEANVQVGIRSILAAGAGKPPFPKKFSRWNGRSRRDQMISFNDQMATTETLIRRWHGHNNGQIHICLHFATHRPDLTHTTPTLLDELKAQAQIFRNLSQQYGVMITQDGHTRGTVRFHHEELDLLGPRVFLSHCTDLTAAEIEILRQTDTRVAHNPSAVFSIMGRCPVPELLDAGVTVMICSDGTAPDRSYDMFRHMWQCMHYHRTYYRDPAILPPGKALEMVTIDAARGLGLEQEIGSLEVGKRADVILVDLHKPHTYPLNMPLYRLVYFANGSDVDTVIVDGKILMEKRQVQTVDEEAVLATAQQEIEAAIDRVGLRHFLDMPDRFWGHSKY